MSDSEKKPIVPPVPTSSAAERVLEAVHAGGVAAVTSALEASGCEPFMASTVGQFLGGYFSAAFSRRKDAWVEQLASGVKWLLSNALTKEDLASNEELLDLMLEATSVAMRTRHESKRIALRNAIANAGTEHAPTEAKQRLFVRLIDEIDLRHMSLLVLMHNPAEFAAARGQPLDAVREVSVVLEMSTGKPSPRSLRSLVGSLLADDIPPGLEDLTKQDLVRMGLVDQGIRFNVRCSDKSLLSELGEEFMRFIKDPGIKSGDAGK